MCKMSQLKIPKGSDCPSSKAIFVENESASFIENLRLYPMLHGHGHAYTGANDMKP